MARREDKAVAVRPVGVVGIVAHNLGVEQVRERCIGHRGAGVAGVGLLHAVHGECADGVDG